MRNRLIMMAVLLLLETNTASAQIGVAVIGTSTIGQDQLSHNVIGKASTKACLFPGGSCATGCPVYVFTGSGNWDLPNNWKDFLMPPAELPACYEILIDPLPSGECVLNVPLQLLTTGSKITIAAGKKFTIPAGLEIKERK